MAFKVKKETGFVAVCGEKDCDWKSNLSVTPEDADAAGRHHELVDHAPPEPEES